MKPTSQKSNSMIGKHLTGKGGVKSSVSGFASQSTARGGGNGGPNSKINEEEEDTDFHDSALAATDDVTDA